MDKSDFLVLVVDDNEMNRDMFERCLSKCGYSVRMAKNGLDALDMLESNYFDLVLLDLMMPEIDGYGVLERMKANDRMQKPPVIVISAHDEIDSAVKCIEMGAEDYLTKPVNRILLKTKVSAVLEKKRLQQQETELRIHIEKYNEMLEIRISEQIEEISSAHMGAIFALSKLAESRDNETGEHLERMREYCKIISEYLSGLKEYEHIIDDEFINNIYAASPLHDIGKVGVPDSILLKPGKLTDEEWVTMKMHSVIGADTLRAVDREHPGNSLIKAGIEIAESHHEKWNGTGYPHGSSGKDIPLSARILAVGDVYDALTSRRCYKKAFSHEKSCEIIICDSGKHFDPDIVDVFIAVEKEFEYIRNKYSDGLEEPVKYSAG